jgi:hypothetical protein
LLQNHIKERHKQHRENKQEPLPADAEDEQRMGRDRHSHSVLCAVQIMTFELCKGCHMRVGTPPKKIPLNTKTRFQTCIGIKVACIKYVQTLNSRKIVHKAYGALAGTTKNIP